MKDKSTPSNALRHMHLTFVQGTSDKFYDLKILSEGPSFVLVTTYGRNGTSGNVSQEQFATANEAENAMLKAYNKKTKRGYQEEFNRSGIPSRVPPPRAPKPTLSFNVANAAKALVGGQFNY